jgi:hypothetical protein
VVDIPGAYIGRIMSKAREPRLVLCHDLRFECAGPVARRLQLDRTEVTLQLLLRRAVSAVAAVIPAGSCLS